MTRHGTLVYYLSAWILGCFFMSAVVWMKDTYAATLNHPFADFAFGLLYFSFFGFISGAVAALIGGFVLRRLMSGLKCKTPSHWAIAGAILTPAIVALLGIWGRRIEMQTWPGMRVLGLVTFGPKTVLEAGWWLAVPAGALTAFLLCRIQRAFAPEKSAVNA
jgi:hypothetical protein